MMKDKLLDGTEPVKIERYISARTNRAIGTSNIVFIPGLANNKTRSVAKYRAQNAEK